jgi:hypothetical protein
LRRTERAEAQALSPISGAPCKDQLGKNDFFTEIFQIKTKPQTGNELGAHDADSGIRYFVGD